MPVYNEGDVLDSILDKILSLGYLDRISFVNDASIDETGEILQRWEESHGIDVLHLTSNRKKEGAIREVIERLHESNELPDFIVLLDADSFIDTAGCSVDSVIDLAINQIETSGLAAVALRIDALISNSSSVLQRCIFSDYSASQFDQWLTSLQGQLWVINGPGGVFRSLPLLAALRHMTPDFETGDLLITVRLMQRNLPVGFCSKVGVKTTVPSTLPDYFRQRRRWERGTTKVMWNERSFYARLFPRFRILGLQTLLHLSIYMGTLVMIAEASLTGEPGAVVAWHLSIAGSFWLTTNLAKVLLNPHARASATLLQLTSWTILNALLWLAVTSLARMTGLMDALRYLWLPRFRGMQAEATARP